MQHTEEKKGETRVKRYHRRCATHDSSIQTEGDPFTRAAVQVGWKRHSPLFERIRISVDGLPCCDIMYDADGNAYDALDSL
jgi:hypothetical protein